MEIRTHFDHFNINVSDLERSLEFYRKALGPEKTGEIVAKDGSFIINYVSRPGETFSSGADLVERPYSAIRTRGKRKPSRSMCGGRLR